MGTPQASGAISHYATAPGLNRNCQWTRSSGFDNLFYDFSIEGDARRIAKSTLPVIETLYQYTNKETAGLIQIYKETRANLIPQDLQFALATYYNIRIIYALPKSLILSFYDLTELLFGETGLFNHPAMGKIIYILLANIDKPKELAHLFR